MITKTNLECNSLIAKKIQVNFVSTKSTKYDVFVYIFILFIYFYTQIDIHIVNDYFQDFQYDIDKAWAWIRTHNQLVEQVDTNHQILSASSLRCSNVVFKTKALNLSLEALKSGLNQIYVNNEENIVQNIVGGGEKRKKSCSQLVYHKRGQKRNGEMLFCGKEKVFYYFIKLRQLRREYYIII